MSACLRAKLLGGFSVYWGDVPLVEPGSRINKNVELLALLLVGDKQPLDNQQLMEALWEGEAANPAGALKNAVYSLRRLLEQMGSGSLKNSFIREERGNEMENAIVQTVAAYASLSRDKVGALMVFERKTMLDDVIKTGTELDARVSAELLKNLFWNKAPLHDGAVILREGRIVGGGCMLPLSGNVNLSKDLGMRHRAGIGISENSDAVVAIVSEETGSISVAINGMLKRHLSPETLERLLRNELLPDPEPKSSPGSKLTGIFRWKKGDKSDGKENSGQ